MKRPLLSVGLLLGAPCIFFVAFFLAPMLVVALSSFTGTGGSVTLANYERILLDRYHWDVLILTFKLALLTTVICIFLGYPLAYYLVRNVGSRTLRRAFIVLLILPLFTSNIVRSFGWIVLLGRKGLVNDSLLSLGISDAPMRLLGTETGILIGLVYVHLPFIVLTVGNAIGKLDGSLENAAQDLGASKAAAFWTVTFPLCLPGLLAGAIMVFTLSVSAYVTPALLGGGKITMFSMLIFQQYSTVFDFHYGGALSCTLLVLTLIMVAAANRIGATGRPA
ncbi:binding-protein-dependent transport systems inner membrane component [Caballeronia arvi]|uniref:Binding-protein-dependent transport systems inner membrane component n=1 Tax=Caballeronia arvi TaxID=1777135 RepID=A0A158IS70_9BURK|nr:ABC transporter permease [Caballeronia arvi]SAL58881.1 binding-protein-dependent transport systems inner membrane component [Caballeronia arvi]